MKKLILSATLLAFATGMQADEWQKPVYNGPFAPLTAGDTVYIYNTEAKQFMTEGNDWGTHVSVGDEGIKCWINQYVAEGQEWDGVSYTIGNYSAEKKGNYIMFITDGGNVYVDGSTSKTDFLFSFKEAGDKLYNIVGSPANPTWTASGDFEGYLMGRFTNYNNAKDNVITGTGVIYDYYGTDHNFGENEFQTTWAFVTSSDYAAYLSKLTAYKTAEAFKAMIDEAKAFGVDVSSAERVYANTSSTTEELNEAIKALNERILAYYETSVTPSSPKTITTDPCDAITDWSNNINATTWNTQNWIDESWQGFDGNTLNIWGSALNGKASKTMSGLPNGIYVVSIAIYSEKMDGYAFANDNRKSVAGASAGNVYNVTTEVTDGTLTYGFGQDAEGTNWVAIDNATINYYGSGVEAYRYWLNGLLESAPSFDAVTAQTSMIEEYEKVLASVNTATTKEEILAIIPAYEEMLNRINLNVEAYNNLQSAIAKASEMAANDSMNTYYGNKLSDASAENTDVIENHTSSTEELNDIIAEMTALLDAAQEYLWNVEKLSNEMTKAAEIYENYGSTCAPSAADDYTQFVNKYNSTDFSNMSNDDVVAMLNELYNVEFNLQIPAEEASEDNPLDYTAKVNFASFDNGAEGWVNAGFGTCGLNDWNGFADGVVIDKLYLNLWNEKAATVSQTITNLPAGKYVVTISAFADAEGFEVFANDSKLAVITGQNEDGVPHIYDGSNEPGMIEGAPSVYYGNVYKLTVCVGEDGVLTVGARIANDATVWAMIDNIHLTYYGPATAIKSTSLKANSNNASYTLTGQKADATSRGIVISNGKKIMRR